MCIYHSYYGGGSEREVCVVCVCAWRSHVNCTLDRGTALDVSKQQIGTGQRQ